MIEQIMAWLIIAAICPVALLAVFDVNTGRGFWSDYKDMVALIGGFAALIGCILALVWAIAVVTK